MPTIDNWRALRDALDQMFEVCAHLDVWKYREGETNEWGAQCYEIDCETNGVDELATAYDPETAAYIAAAHPAAIRSLLDERDRLAAEVEALRAQVNRAVRGSLMVGDALHHQILAMRAAAVAGELENPERGMQWIINTLAGPGNLPDLDEARAIGGAQAMFDKEMAEHEAFREEHPAPTLDAAMKGKP